MNRLAINAELHATLKRSRKRRTLGIKVHRGEVTVSAPMGASVDEVQRFLQQKQRWIEKHVAHQRLQAQHLPSPIVWQNGCTLHLLGQTLRLQIADPQTPAQIDWVQRELVLPCTPLSVREQIGDWYHRQAELYLPDRVAHFAAQMDLHPKQIKIRHYKTRWGSCTSRGQVQFNWLIMMAPPAVVDYVVVHELAHLRHFNHSREFWQKVAQTLPLFAEQRRWLKTQRHLLW